MTRGSQLFGGDAALAQERRDPGPLRGRSLEARACVLDKGDTTFRFMKGRGLQDAAFKSYEWV